MNRQQTLDAAVPMDYTKAAPDKAGRFHQLDGLRAVAVTLVLLHHSFTARVGEELATAGNLLIQSGDAFIGQAMVYFGALLRSLGGSGVELFFVLSGIVLLRPYLRGIRTFNVGSYMRRRAERLWPPYLIALFAEGVMLWIMTQWPNWNSLEREQRFSIWGWISQAPILNLGWDMYNVAWWSLTVELIFYLLAPLLVPVFASRAVTRLMFVGVMVASFITAAMLVVILGEPLLLPRSFQHAFISFAVYMPCFLLGLALAKYDVPKRVGHFLVAVGVVYVLSATHFRMMNVHAGYGLLYAGLTVLAFDVGSAWTRFLSSPFMVWLGERSYS